MSLDQTEGSVSDEEIFFGKLTLKEVKKRIFWDHQQKPCIASVVNSPIKQEDPNTSLKILQAHSEPNLLPSSDREPYNQDTSGLLNAGWDMSEDDSFIQLESMVDKMCVTAPTSENNKKTELNNTLEVIEYILNNPPSTENKHEPVTDNKQTKSDNIVKIEDEALNEICLEKLNQISPQKNKNVEKFVPEDSPEQPKNTPVKTEKNFVKVVHKDSPEPPQNTPVKTEKNIVKDTGYMTPIDTKHKLVFKTPAQPFLIKKPSASSLKKTPSKSNAYQHITSPVASYINNCPIAPLVKDVHPKKPLPGPSSIPKLKNTIPVKQSNKENVNLPPVAYKSAKKTKLIDLPNEQKLPECQWAKKIMGSLPRPVVIKHNHRELNFAQSRLLSQQEDSFANLPYQQAEVSVCTQKSAFTVNKHV